LTKPGFFCFLAIGTGFLVVGGHGLEAWATIKIKGKLGGGATLPKEKAKLLEKI
jgi:hypothetical protein